MNYSDPPKFAMKELGFITEESYRRLEIGGNDSRGTVPVHCRPSKTANIPVYTFIWNKPK